MGARPPAPRTCRRIALVLDPNLTERVVRRPSAENPGCQEMAVSATFADAVLVAFRAINPAVTAVVDITNLVIAAMPPAYRLATPSEIEAALNLWEEKGHVSFKDFREFMPC